jgi:hypothetical protein
VEHGPKGEQRRGVFQGADGAGVQVVGEDVKDLGAGERAATGLQVEKHVHQVVGFDRLFVGRGKVLLGQ